MYIRQTMEAALGACLLQSSVPYTNHAIEPFNLRVPVQPLAIATPSTVEQIESTVSCAARLGIRVSGHSGGHSYTSSGLGGEDGHMVVDLAQFDSIEVDDATGVATVGPGARLGELATVLWDHSRGLAHGSCPGVGVGGHALHGGWGTSAHLKGLTIDYIIGAVVTLANGTTIDVSESSHPDVFWALRGAGSSFGVVSQLRFNTFPAPQTVVPFKVTYDWFPGAQNGSTDRAVEALAELQRWTDDGEMPPELWMNVGMDEFKVQSDGQWDGTAAELEAAASDFFASIGGTLVPGREMNWIDAIKDFSGTDGELISPEPYTAHDTFYVTSLTSHALTIDQLRSFTETWANTKSPEPDRRQWWVQFDLHGGKSSQISKVPVDATPYPHRDKLLLFQMYDFVTEGNYPADGFSLLHDLRNSITATMDDDSWGMYANYPDSQASDEEAARRYWGVNLERLQSIKASVDPNDVFRYPQGVRPATGYNT